MFILYFIKTLIVINMIIGGYKKNKDFVLGIKLRDFDLFILQI